MEVESRDVMDEAETDDASPGAVAASPEVTVVKLAITDMAATPISDEPATQDDQVPEDPKTPSTAMETTKVEDSETETVIATEPENATNVEEKMMDVSSVPVVKRPLQKEVTNRKTSSTSGVQQVG